MTNTKDRLVEAGAELFRRQGYTGTGVKQIVTAASAPFASLYHFFPGGKEQLGEEVIRWSGDLYGRLVDLFFQPGDDPVEATRAFFAAAAMTLEETDFADACPIATIALEVSSVSEPMRRACSDVFEGWVAKLVDALAQSDVDESAARDVGVALFCLLEGAFVMCRATRSTEALATAGEVAASTVARARG